MTSGCPARRRHPDRTDRRVGGLSLARVMSYANDMSHVAPPVRPASASSLAADLRVSVMRLARRVRQQRSDDDISTGQYSVLGALVTHGPRRHASWPTSSGSSRRR